MSVKCHYKQCKHHHKVILFCKLKSCQASAKELCAFIEQREQELKK